MPIVNNNLAINIFYIYIQINKITPNNCHNKKKSVKCIHGDDMKYFLIGIIQTYQMIPGRIHNLCRYQPTCSEYMKQAIIKYGTIKGLYLGIKRILRCNPFGTSGYDPVPNFNQKGENNHEKN